MLGQTPTEEEAQEILRDFAEGRTQHLTMLRKVKHQHGLQISPKFFVAQCAQTALRCFSFGSGEINSK